MQLHCFYMDALERVLAWDLPDDVSPYAVSAAAGLLAGFDSEQLDRSAEID
jgi:hypothetical protein